MAASPAAPAGWRAACGGPAHPRGTRSIRSDDTAVLGVTGVDEDPARPGALGRRRVVLGARRLLLAVLLDRQDLHLGPRQPAKSNGQLGFHLRDVLLVEIQQALPRAARNLVSLSIAALKLFKSVKPSAWRAPASVLRCGSLRAARADGSLRATGSRSSDPGRGRRSAPRVGQGPHADLGAALGAYSSRTNLAKRS